LYADMVNHGAPDEKTPCCGSGKQGNDNTVRPDEGQSSGKDALSGETFSCLGSGPRV
jgi:hypothetical protein